MCVWHYRFLISCWKWLLIDMNRLEMILVRQTRVRNGGRRPIPSDHRNIQSNPNFKRQHWAARQICCPVPDLRWPTLLIWCERKVTKEKCLQIDNMEYYNWMQSFPMANVKRTAGSLGQSLVGHHKECNGQWNQTQMMTMVKLPSVWKTI